MKKIFELALVFVMFSCTQPRKEKSFDTGKIPNNVGYADSVFVATEMDTLR